MATDIRNRYKYNHSHKINLYSVIEIMCIYSWNRLIVTNKLIEIIFSNITDLKSNQQLTTFVNIEVTI